MLAHRGAGHCHKVVGLAVSQHDLADHAVKEVIAEHVSIERCPRYRRRAAVELFQRDPILLDVGKCLVGEHEVRQVDDHEGGVRAGIARIEYARVFSQKSMKNGARIST